MKKGITIWAFKNGTTGNLDLKEVMRKTKEAGFEALELSFYEKGAISFETSFNELNVFKKKAQNVNISLSSLSTLLLNNFSLTANSIDERRYAYRIVERMLEIAALLEMPTISISPGMVTAEVSYKTAYDRAFESIQKLGEVAKKMRVQLCLENVWQGLLQSPLEFNQFVVNLENPYVGICLDIGNTLLLGYPQHWVEIMQERIYKIHIDNVRRRRGRFLEFTSLEDGDVNWSLTMKALQKIGYKGYATVEAFYNNSTEEMVQLKKINKDLQQIIGLLESRNI